MNRPGRKLAAALVALALAACSNSDPGPVAGTWRVIGPVPMTVQFRAGETEALGVIEKAAYEIKGSDVIVTYKSGPMAGTGMRLRIVGPDKLQSELGAMHRIR